MKATISFALSIVEDCAKRFEVSGLPNRGESALLMRTPVTWNMSKRYLGVASHKYYGTMITLSKPIFSLDSNFHHFEDTVRHECAHIVAGVNEGHSCKWKCLCTVFGAKPNRLVDLSSGFTYPEMRYKYRCACGAEHLISRIKHRRLQDMVTSYLCDRCKAPVKPAAYSGQGNALGA